jgi:hypothetical protein
MNFEFWLQFAGVVGLVAFSDVCWTFYFIKTADRYATQAGAWSAMVVGFGAVSTVAYVHDVRLVFAAMLGAFLGTYFTIKFFNDNQEE